MDTRTQAERDYDAMKDGTLYTKPQPTNDGREHPADEDIPLSADEEIVIDLILKLPGGREVPIVRSRDEAHRQERWNALLDKIIDMDEDERNEMLAYTEGLLDGMLMRQEPAA